MVIHEMRLNAAEQGAAGDGKTLNTQAIQTAIDLCSQAGGGTVYFPPGNYVSGTLFLKSNVTMELDAGAVLTASPKIQDYSPDTHHNRYRNEKALDRCFLYAQDQENIRYRGIGGVKRGDIPEKYLSNLQFSSVRPDEREAFYVEGCGVLKQEIFVLPVNGEERK